LSAEQARVGALEFGNPESVRDRVWPMILSWIEDGWRDLRFALRSLANVPGFTALPSW